MQAASVLDQVFKQNSTNVDFLNTHSAVICALPGRNDEALRNIDKALSFVPAVTGAELWATKSFIQFLGGKFDPAVLSAKNALLRNSDLPQAHFAMALALSGLKQYLPSLPYYERVCTDQVYPN